MGKVMSTSKFAVGVIAAACLGVLPGAASAAVTTKASGSPAAGVRELPPGKTYSTSKLGPVGDARAQRKAAPSLQAAQTPPVGTVRQWIALDDANGTLYRKDYTLRGVGDHIEVWVANDLSFPAGDCRAQIPNSTEITDAQVQHLITEFDGNMYPKETAAFSTPPDRDGSNAQIGPDANGQGGDYAGDGDNTVALIDNVRDDNYYTFPAAPTYIAGFFSSQFN
jgi:hypothetical protein